MLLIGKPSISMGRGFHGYVSHNQRAIAQKCQQNLSAEYWLIGGWTDEYENSMLELHKKSLR